jgi:hypothetical protein
MEEEKRKMFETQQPADVALLTSDGVSLRVHKWPLAQSSSIFQQMFSLPQPGSDSTTESLPSVEVEETSGIMIDLLRFIYPEFSTDDLEFWFPEWPEQGHETFWRLEKVYVAADKYEIAAVKRSIVGFLCNPEVVHELPFDCYSFAILHEEPVLKLQALMHCTVKREKGCRMKKKYKGDANLRRLIEDGHLSALGHYELGKDYKGE